MAEPARISPPTRVCNSDLIPAVSLAYIICDNNTLFPATGEKSD